MSIVKQANYTSSIAKQLSFLNEILNKDVNSIISEYVWSTRFTKCIDEISLLAKQINKENKVKVLRNLHIIKPICDYSFNASYFNMYIPYNTLSNSDGSPFIISFPINANNNQPSGQCNLSNLRLTLAN